MMNKKLREAISAAASAGQLAEAREYASRTGRMPEGWTRDPDAIITCPDMWQEGCQWRGTEAQATLIDDALCCPLCSSIL